MKTQTDWRKNENGRFTRTTALLLISALLCPLLLLKPTQSVSAKSSSPAIQTPVAPISAPPEPFVLSSTTNAISSDALSSVTSFGSLVANGYTSVLGFFTAPQIPAEFVGATAVSPFSTYLSSASLSISSSVSSLGSFFGFAEPAAPAAMLLSQPRANVQFDFDGDGKADIGRFHRANAEWKVRLSSNGAYGAAIVGSSSSVIAPGDFDGDGTTDAAVFNNGTWTVRKSSTGSSSTVSFGQAGDKPAVGDYDGDGKSDYAIFRPSTSTWWFNKSTDNSINSYQFGQTGDIPVAGDYDGDSKTDFAVYRPSVGDWYVMGSTAGFSSLQWGNATDIPVPADYDGDGKTDRAVYRGSTGQWFIAKSSDGGYLAPSWGNYGDQPVPADYDGDGKADIAVFRPTNTVWYITRSAPPGGFDAWNLGVPDDTPVEAAYLRQIGGEVYNYDFARTRLSPKNGGGGTNLYSRNFSWGTSLVGLSGRAGLDAGFGISYNSLIWTKQGSAMVFDADKSNVAPGFRFGYPTIEPVYYDATTQKFNYLMITPSGAKVEFRQQQGASNVYETADSSYTQLKINGTGNPNDAAEDLPIIVTTTDGTQMSYSYISGAYRCTQIKDANGNYITIFNDEYGLLRSVTDTLGRVIDINYDSNLNLTSISQTWKDNNGQGSNVTHIYATFTYANQAINTNFSTNINTIYGPQGVTTRVLQSIAYADGASTKFDYNSYGQVYKTSSIAADSPAHVLNYTKVNLSDADLSTGQTDCPRFSEARNWVENFNQNSSGVAQEVVINNSITENASYNVGGASGTATKIEVSMTGEPNGHISKTFVGASGWMEGLPVATEDWANENNISVRKRWTLTSWTQDNPALSYILNPRTIESKVGDATNVKRTTIDYITQSGITLPNQVKVYDSNQTTVLKTGATEYNWNSTYLQKRIIGLPAKSELYDQNGSLMSKVTYAYDAGDFSDTTLNQNLSSAIQHDNTNYGASFTAGRGNLTSTTRWDVNYPTDASQAVTSNVKYNTAGAPVAQITPSSDSINPTRTVKIGYADTFNDDLNTRNTFAYPTTLTDPAGNFSLVKYRFDIGANVWAKSPAPANNTSGKETSREFDALGRLLKQTLLNTGAYTRYDYTQSDRDVHSKVYSTVIDTDSNGASATDEVLSEAWTDGAGRVRQSKSPLRFNASGAATAWAGTITEYDVLGQVKRQSVPTEVDANFNASGDDLTRGFLWTSQEYDWKGRTTRTVNTDGTDKLISYDGCGCAGGQVTTVKGENITETDWQGSATTNLGRRTQKIYADILGRAYKTEIMNWDGATPYTSAVTEFNGRDQAVSTTRYKGAAGSANPEATTFQYDGHGRLKQQHAPSQDAAANISYAYFNDDSVQTATDGRGASVSYTYNDARGLLTRADYSAPQNSGIQVPTATEFGYDALGNRTWMTDSLGRADYVYDSLSRVTQETRTITNVGAWTLSYEYGLSGQLKSVNQPDDTTRNVGYEYDRAGSLKKVSGGFANVPYYADGIDYRAFGAAKSLTYGSGKQLTQSYNNLMQLAEYKVADASGEETRTQFDYYADGRVKFVRDKTNNQRGCQIFCVIEFSFSPGISIRPSKSIAI
jgi:hypothetical protein